MERKAGFWIRFAALLIDGLIIGVISFLLAGILRVDMDHIRDGTNFLYQLILPVLWAGYTLGKKAVGIQIVKLDDTPPTLGTMLMRNLVAGLIYVLTLGIGLIISAFMVGLGEEKRAIHDYVAGTYVRHDS